MKWTAAIFMGLIAAGWVEECRAQVLSARQIHTNKRQFSIPFQLSDGELIANAVKEVRLYVSVDRGNTWRQVQSVAPKTGRFYVRAPQDGSYWFAVRTLGRNNRERPSAEQIDPELKVRVDTTPPKFQVRLSQPEPGTVRLTWSADDANLDESSLVLESLQRGRSKWSKVFVSGKAIGSTSWNVPQGGTVEVRGRIADKAGNVTERHDSTKISAAGESVPRQPVPDFHRQNTSTATANERRRVIPEQFPGSLDPELRIKGWTVTGDAASTRPQREVLPNATGSEALQHRFGHTPAGDSPPASQQVSEPPKMPQRIVNRRDFQIGYRVDKVGSSGVRRIELYITQDNGRKWYRYGTDEDRTSPFSVVVPEDGVYGFVLRVRSGAGLAEPPPQPGDKPAISVIVDKTPPSLRLLPILQGTGADMERFLIRWKSADVNPAAKPIAIAYSAGPNGPWNEISDWKTNTGIHDWTIDADVPPRVYVRLSARDKAGNVARIQTSRPIIVDLVKPSAQITGVKSQGARVEGQGRRAVGD